MAFTQIDVARTLATLTGSRTFVLADTTFGRRNDALLCFNNSNISNISLLTFPSCCVDEISAAHVNADCVVCYKCIIASHTVCLLLSTLLMCARPQIHFGRSCLSSVSRTPAFLVLPVQDIDVSSCASQLLKVLPD